MGLAVLGFFAALATLSALTRVAWPWTVLAAALTAALTVVLAVALAVAAARAGIALQQAARHAALRQSIAGYLAGEQPFGDDLTPVWSVHIDSSREQMAMAIAALSRRFAAIAAKLNAAWHTAGRETETMDPADEGLAVVFGRSERERGVVIASQQSATSRLLNRLDKVRGPERFVVQLQDMAGEVAEIAQQTRLLWLKAAIEAARSGEQGRGFAVVAKQFRMLSTHSAETARRIADMATVIGSEIVVSVELVRDAVQQRDGSAPSAQAAIGRVLNDFRRITDALLRASTLLKDDSLSIQSKPSEALVQWQLQCQDRDRDRDRVHQIMNHVKDKLARLPAFLQQRGASARRRRRVAAAECATLAVRIDRHPCDRRPAGDSPGREGRPGR